MSMHEYRNLGTAGSTATKIKPLPSSVPINKHAGARHWYARLPIRPFPIGKKLFRCIEVATLLTFLQGQFLPSDHDGKLTLKIGPAPAPLHLAQEETTLEERIRAASDLKGIHAGVFVVELESGQYANVNGKEKFAAASMIKLPVLVSLLAAVDSGEVKKEQLLTLREDLVTGGSGFLQWRPKGAKVSVDQAAQLMMVISDNTATNLLIDHLGGKTKLNREFSQWGLTDTKINNWLADFEGSNTTSPYDLVYLMGRLDRGEILSKDSRDWLLNVMRHTRIRTLLPQGLPPGTVIAHKTGDIAGMVGDAGIVTTPDGRNYLVAVQVSRPRNDRRANLLIRTISKLIYNDFGTGKTNRCAHQPSATGSGTRDILRGTAPAIPHEVEAVQNTVQVKPASAPDQAHAAP
jgi:beta-lactamase class A